MYDLSAGVLDAECIIDTYQRLLREIGRIGEYLVTDRLYLIILSGIDLETAGIHGLVGLLAGISLFIDQVVKHLVDEGILIVGIDRGIFLRRHFIGLNAVVYMISHRLLIIRLGDIALGKHPVKHSLAAGGICFRRAPRVIPGRVLGDRCDHSRLGQSEQ